MSSEIDEFRSSLVAAVQAELERHASAVVAEVDRLREEDKKSPRRAPHRAHRAVARRSAPGGRADRNTAATRQVENAAHRRSSSASPSPRPARPAASTTWRQSLDGLVRAAAAPADAGDARRAGGADPQGRRARRQPAQVRRAGGPHGHLLQRRQPEHGAAPGRVERGAQGRHRRPHRHDPEAGRGERRRHPPLPDRGRPDPPRRRSTTPRTASTTGCSRPRAG